MSIKLKVSARGKDNSRGEVSEQVLIVGGPPISLTRFCEQMGVNAITAWRWRRDGMLKTVNICGRQYVRSEDVADFNRRALAGEFAKDHTTPRKPGAQAETEPRSRRRQAKALAA